MMWPVTPETYRAMVEAHARKVAALTEDEKQWLRAEEAWNTERGAALIRRVERSAAEMQALLEEDIGRYGWPK